MLSIHEKAHFTNRSDYSLQHAVAALLNLRIAQLTRADGIDLEDVTHFLVIQPGNTMAAVQQEVGFTPLTNLSDGSTFGSPDFTPSWEWIVDHHGCFELVYIVSDDGFAFVLIVEDSPGLDPGLLALCHQYSGSDDQVSSLI